MKLHRDFAGFLKKNHREYGDIFTIKAFPMGPVVVVAKPEILKEILTENSDLFLGGEANQPAEVMLGPRSIFLTDAESHLRQRRFMLPQFHGENITRFRERIAEITRREIASWPEGESLRLQPRMQAIAMEVILQLVFGIEDEASLAEMRRRFALWREPLKYVVLFPWMRRNFGPRSPWPQFLERRANVDELIFAEIASRRADPRLEERFDILSLLLRARDDQGRAMPDADVRDQLMTMVVAGYETTAAGLAWAGELLARHPEAQAKLRRAAVSEDPDERAYIDAVTSETLRMRPPLSHVARRLARPTTIDGYDLPAGMAIMVPIVLVHQREDLHPDPDTFRPERFLETRIAPYTFMPFGAGLRRCLGASLATLEMQVVLATIAREMSFLPVSEKAEAMKLFHVILVPQHGATVHVKREQLAPSEGLPRKEVVHV